MTMTIPLGPAFPMMQRGITADTLGVLLVDDNPDDRTLVLRELRREFGNVRATEVRDAQEFAQALAAEPLDLVITDYQLRWTNGLAVLHHIKMHWPECPVLMFTGTG